MPVELSPPPGETVIGPATPGVFTVSVTVRVVLPAPVDAFVSVTVAVCVPAASAFAPALIDAVTEAVDPAAIVPPAEESVTQLWLTDAVQSMEAALEFVSV